jgi:predicted 2-oxoglutarate/Fe(II)-dependent dioxygenase YbiX
VFHAGDPVPWFQAPASNGNAAFDFGLAAGRYVALCFVGSAAEPAARAALDEVIRTREVFDDLRAAFFGITTDPADLEQRRVEQLLPGIRWFWDFDGAVSRSFRALPEGGGAYRPYWLVLDPMLRVLGTGPLERTGDVLRYIATLPAPAHHAGIEVHPPVLILPRVFEPEVCRHLIDLYGLHGGTESGFVRDVDGRTRTIVDHRHKRRADFTIEDEGLRAALRERITRRLVPEIHKAFQFAATRMERYIVACYDGETGGHFRAHRDNTSKGTAHRRFAVTINLNAEEYSGGELRLPEFGPRAYKAPTGGAVVFSCSLLHEVLPVTAGRRYAFLPFLYDEAAARVRAENDRFLGEEIGRYTR